MTGIHPEHAPPAVTAPEPGRAAAPTPGQAREELIARATRIHDEAGCGCDPKYIMSCPNMAAAVLGAGKPTAVTGVTPGQAAYEAYDAHLGPIDDPGDLLAPATPWEDVKRRERAAWEAAAQAAAPNLAALHAQAQRQRDAALARIAELETQLAAVTAERDEHRRELTQAIAGGWTDDATRRVAEISADNAMLRAGLEAVRPVLDCFKRGSDGWRGRVSAVILARAYAAIGAVPGYLKHVEGQ